ncbi:MAG: GvpL/GvpF family gas vesicle protein [Actinomycetes bacterium]
MTESGTYLFAVAVADRFDLPADLTKLPGEFGQVRAVAADGLVALVSSYSGPAIEDVPQNELTGRLLLHQKVIEDLMPGGSLLPVRVGTVLKDDEGVASFLGGSQKLLLTTWEQFRGTVEVDIAATWNLGEVLAQVSVDPEVVAAKAAAMSASPESRPAAVVGVGQLVGRKLDQRRSELESLVLASMSPLAKDVRLNAVVSDELVCNLALLVDTIKAGQIDDALHRLDADLEGRYDFRRVGPLPPYSFATVHVNRIEPSQLQQALAMLGLPGSFDESAVLERYRELAMARHPDVRTGDPGAAKDFEELTSAKAIALSVCRNRTDTSEILGSTVLFASIERSAGRD